MAIEEILSHFIPILSQLPLENPIAGEQDFFVSQMHNIPTIPIDIKNKCRLVIYRKNFGSSTNKTLGIFNVSKIKEVYLLTIIYNKDLDDNFYIQENSFIRKAVIVHEFCHCLSYINMLTLAGQPGQLLLLENKYSQKFRDTITIRNFIAPLMQHDFMSEMPHFTDHFKYCAEDTINYQELFEKLIVPDNTIDTHLESYTKLYPFKRFITNQEYGEFSKWVVNFIGYLSGKIMVKENIIFARVMNKIPSIITNSNFK